MENVFSNDKQIKSVCHYLFPENHLKYLIYKTYMALKVTKSYITSLILDGIAIMLYNNYVVYEYTERRHPQMKKTTKPKNISPKKVTRDVPKETSQKIMKNIIEKRRSVYEKLSKY